MHDITKIRNFSIIAHIDHGKSTLADRIIEFCKAVHDKQMQDQILDSMDIERERGITIKSQTVRLNYKAQDGQNYVLNLMDTPGHIDFAYEVSRCLSACDGSLLLVDTTQGVEAQTLANVYKAIDANHEIIPVLNKTDLPSSDINGTKAQIEEVIGLDTSNAVLTSGKTGAGVDNLLESIIKYIPAPSGNVEGQTKVLLVDAWYDQYLGVVMLISVREGVLKLRDKIKMLHNGSVHEVEKLGFFMPKRNEVNEIKAGEVGYMCANIRLVADCLVGDTIVLEKDTTTKPLPGFKKVQPVVFCGLYPSEPSGYVEMKTAVEKLALNDSSISYEVESSAALGFGLRCGFLGLLHMEIVQERLEREYDADLVTTAPSVVYKMYLNDGTVTEISNPATYPDPVLIREIEEPLAKVSIFTPGDYLGDIMKLCTDKRGSQIDLNYSSGNQRVMLVYKIPLAEIVLDFHDKLKSISKGYASFEWEIAEYVKSDVVKVSILLNGDSVDALSIITHRSRAEQRGRALCAKLRELIPRQMFAVPIQAAIGAKIIARETISAMRKDVTAKCYGGDISRKRKLLDKQKAGKKRMKMLGSVEVPQSAFLAVLKISDD
ncbi:translation elongation factor 4 [Candidatus Deianiraea vastatrix]|uniref:translation elongation factor 4 n=1 Tax=Candidatus Deianiraea vastatrix TaxID=2163644 RepID=UPI001CA455BE|nr:translation elongation factor 4 [Candidatus Deianiraea vastatrix]